MATTLNQDTNPYVGPRTFRPEERARFFGRTREARDLTALIVSNRLVLFYAPSGAGKSSLLNTMINPMLAEAGFEVLPTGRVSGCSSEDVSAVNIFIYNLLLSVQESTEIPANFATLSLAEFLDNLVQHEDGAYYYDPAYLYPPETLFKPRVLLIDQSEELVTTNAALWPQRAGFFEQLAEALALDEHLWVVLTMREDYVTHFDPYLHLTPNRLRQRYYMERLARPAAIEAMQRPMENIRPFTADAVEQLADNLLRIRTSDGQESEQFAQFVEPVQLQAVCYQMWEKLKSQPGQIITRDDVLAFADVDAALVNFYEETIADTVAKTSVSEIILRNWFETALITEGGTRNMVFRGQREVGGLHTSVADHVHKRFIVHEISRPGGIWYELIHDRFIQPIQEANRAWRLDQPLPRLAQKWEEAGHTDELLLGDRELKRLTAETNWQAMGPLVSKFVKASQKARQREELARRQQEMDQQRALADEQRKRADEADVARLRQRKLTTLASIIGLFALVAAIVSIILGVVAAGERKTAVAEAERADNNAATAEAEATQAAINLELAVTSKALAIANGEEAQANLATATVALQEAMAAEERAKTAEAEANSLRLADKAVDFLNGSNVNGALLLSRMAVLSSTTTSAQGALFQALNVAADQAGSSSYRPADPEAATAFRRELTSPGVSISLLFAGPQPATLATVKDDMIIWWEAQEPRPVTYTIQLTHTIEQAAFNHNPNQTLLVTADGPVIHLWQEEDGEWQHLDEQELNSRTLITKIAFSLDNGLLAVSLCISEESGDSPGESDCTVQIWEIEDGQLQNEKMLPIGGIGPIDLAFTTEALVWSNSTEIGIYMISNSSLRPEIPPREPGYVFGALAFVEPLNSLVIGGCYGRESCDPNQNNFIRWWNLDEGTWLTQEPIPIAAPVDELVYIYLGLPDQQGAIIAVVGDNRLSQWLMDVEEWSNLACRIAGRNLTADEWQAVFPTDPYPFTCPFEQHFTVTEWILDKTEQLVRTCEYPFIEQARQQYTQAGSSNIDIFSDWALPILLDKALQSDTREHARQCSTLAANFASFDTESFLDLWAEIDGIKADPETTDLSTFAEFYENLRSAMPEPVVSVVDEHVSTLYGELCFRLPVTAAAGICSRYNQLMKQSNVITNFVPITPTGNISEQGNWIFEGKAGDLIAISMNAVESGDPYLRLLGGDFTPIASDDDSGGHLNALIELPLPEDGIYYIDAGWLGTPGNYTLLVTRVEPESLTIGDTIPEAAPEQRWWQFEGNQGDIVAIAMDALDGGEPLLRLLDANGNEIAYNYDGGDGLNALIQIILPEDGTYYIDAGWLSTSGPYALSVIRSEPENLTIGDTIPEAAPEQRWWQFEGNQGDIVTIAMDARDDGDPLLLLLNANGNEIAYNHDGGGGFNALIQIFLPEDGTYYIDARWSGTPGPYTLSLMRFEPESLTIGDPIREAAPEQRWWQFEGRQGDFVAIAMDALDGGDPLLRLLDANGNEIAYDDDGGGGYNALIQIVLPDDGTYYIDAGWYSGPGRYTLSLTRINPVDTPFVASVLLKEFALYLVRQGQVEEALGFFAEAQTLDAGLLVTAEDYNNICWFGSLWGFAAQVLFACDEAAALAPDHGGIADSRGVARAMTGDFVGAIEDFRFFIQWNGPGYESELREEWIEELEAGNNPFEDESLLEFLRNG